MKITFTIQPTNFHAVATFIYLPIMALMLLLHAETTPVGTMLINGISTIFGVLFVWGVVACILETREYRKAFKGYSYKY